MAEECISVYFESSNSSWDYCWEDLTPYPDWSADNVDTGLRKSQSTYSRAWRTCQYYMRGVPAICKWWAEGAVDDEEGTTTSGSFYCSYVGENTSDNPQDPPPEEPSGYNYAQCDFLGRRKWCTKYEESTTADPNEWICVAPNPYLTGLGKKSLDNEQAIFTPVVRSDIWGYNDALDGTGKGFCDCHGMGRGEAGCGVAVLGDDASAEDKSNVEEILNGKPVICNFYRPYQMGFGIIDPAIKYPGDVLPDGTITDQGWKNAQAWEDDVDYRLPLNYEMYNNRAKFQKCQWWSKDTGSDYVMDGFSVIIEDEAEGDPFDDDGKIEFCTNTSVDVESYNHRVLTASGSSWIPGATLGLENVWATAGGPVCNGCRPDCPGYSGKWLYITNDKMYPGMPVTANQILELRFWSSEWDSKEDYDKYYEHKPNFDDARTSSIYTFTKWQHLDPVNPDQSIMLGKKLDLCMPAPINNRQFTRDYVEEEEITYASVKTVNNNTGTNVSDQYHFPSLVRNPQFVELDPLTVLYPYYNDDVFNPEICIDRGPPGHIKRHNIIYGDSIRSIGYTMNDKKVYVINTKEVPIQAVIKDYSGAYQVESTTLKYDIFRSIVYSIEKAKELYSDYIVETTSDEDTGLFVTDGVKLKYEAVNNLLICVDYGDGTWEWRWRKVDSLWYGGILKQDSYNHTYGHTDTGWENNQPVIIEGDTRSVNMDTFRLGHSASSDVLSSYSFSDIWNGVNYYTWYIAWFHIEDQFQDNWAAVGNSNMILVEIDDLNLNYIYEWEIESAQLIAITEEDEDGEEVKLAGDLAPDEVELEVYNGIQDDDSLPPSFCVLKPIEDIRYRFFNSDWELYISYKYKKFVVGDPADHGVPEDDIVSGVRPGTTNIYRSSPFSNNAGGISEISKGPINLLGYFYDENDRLIATNATKAMVNIVRESCRNLEIKYDYSVWADEWVLEPRSGFCVNIAEKKKTGERRKLSETPDCGDHEGSFPARWIAPQWFPYDSCRGFDLYDEWTICNRCQAGYIGPKNAGMVTDDEGNPVLVGGTAARRRDFRYCGPHKYKAYGEVRSAKPTPCNCGCVFYYVDARSADVEFSGFSRLREPIDEAVWTALEYRLPPFGNDGRELIEKYFSNDYEMYITGTSPPAAKTSWLPMVMDHTMFYFPDFNCYSDSSLEDQYYYISSAVSREPFKYTNQMNYFMGDYLAEYLLEDRYRFEDIFEIHHEGNCSYPKPTYPIDNKNVVLYHFKNNEHAWAWQEYWKEIERSPLELDPEDPTSTVRFRFIELEKPKYRWSAYKEEHRFIAAEGPSKLIYIPPGIDDEGNLTDLPKIGFLFGLSRPFEIMYPEETYISSNKIIWKNVGGSSTVSGSSDEDNLYEKTMQGDWVHDPDTLFDITASSGTDDENVNSIITDIDENTGTVTTKYYNTGVIAKITRDRLDYLPKFTYDFEYTNNSSTDSEFTLEEDTIEITHEETYQGSESIFGTVVWDADSVTMTSADDISANIQKLKIKGLWGSTLKADQKGYNYSLWPAVSLEVTYTDLSTGVPRGLNSPMTEVILPDNELEDGELQEYTIELRFLLGPLEFLGNKKIRSFSINIEGLNGYFIAINEITLTTAKLITLEEGGQQEEDITVWERKYKVSSMTGVTHNLDGPGDYIQYDLSKQNSGQYFPWTAGKFSNDEFTSSDSQSRLRSVSCGKRYLDPVDVDISYSTLHDIELNYQKDIYNWASDKKDTLGDSLSLSGFEMPKLYDTLEANNVTIGNMSSMVVSSERLTWEDHELVKRFKQYDYWRPGGHSYEWSQYWQRTKCYIFGPPETIFEGDFRHYDHPYGTEIQADLASTILNSYYNLRFETMVAKANRADLLSGGTGDFLGNDLLTAANPFNPPIRS